MSSVYHQLAFTKPDEATKVAAVRLILDKKATVQDIAEMYRVSNIQVHGWRKAFSSMAASKSTEQKLLDLKEQLEDTEVEEAEEEEVEMTAKKKEKTQHSEEDKLTAVGLYRDGQSVHEVALAYEVSIAAIYNWASLVKQGKLGKKTTRPTQAENKPLQIIKPVTHQYNPPQAPSPQRQLPTATVDNTTGNVEMYFIELEKLKKDNAVMKTIIVDQLLELMKYRGTSN